MNSSASRLPGLRGRRRVLLLGWLVAALCLLARSADLQLVEASEWRALADQQHQARADVAAARGAILDRDGMPLALSHEAFRVGIAPLELQDPDKAAEALVAALELSPDEARRVTRSDRRWVQLPGRFPPSAREALSGIRGIYAERELRRFYPQVGLATGLLGRLVDERGSGGIEQEFEGHLSGTPGTRIVTRDSSGEPIPGESWGLTDPTPGGDVVLTIDMDLQEIAQEAIRKAVDETGARGGDLLVTDPRSGEILAMASIFEGESHQLGAITTPSEPGSTLKPFIVAGLLARDRATLLDSIDTGEGSWRVNGRTIRDVTRVGKVTLSHALQVSSNVGIAKAAAALSPSEQFETLRDFGFGVDTGIDLPGEASGTLWHPDVWSGQSAASLAIGYEMAATPLQIAMAYGALANGGVLMEPRLVRELRTPDGRTTERYEPSVVRRVIGEDVASELKQALVEAVEEGTGGAARLRTFAVAGKSGTAWATDDNGDYESGAYNASFAGFFPAENPQLLVFVRLDRPQGAYYGGTTAAPVTRATMEAVLAARHPPLDRNALAAIARSQEQARRDEESAGSIPTSQSSGGVARGPVASVLFASLDSPREVPPHSISGSIGEGGARLLPDLRGLPARTAIRRLHPLGVQIRWQGQGEITGTIPGAGQAVVAGDTVTVVTRAARPPGITDPIPGGG